MTVPVAVQVLVFLGYGGFLAATFGWKTWRSLRTTGESGWREPVSRTDAIGELVWLAGCASSLLAPPLALAGVVRPLTTDWLMVRVAAGTVALVAGTVLATWAQHHLAEEWRAGVEASTVLVESGPFARVRNPFYLGCVLSSVSVVLAVPSVVAVVGLLLHIVAAQVTVRGVEEPVLTRAHGGEFLRYRERTGRFLPRRTR